MIHPLLHKCTIQSMQKAHKARISKLQKMATLKSQLANIPAAVIDEEEKSQHSSASKTVKKEKAVVTDNIVSILLELGFNLEQIMTGYKIYKFSSEEEALNVMTRDNESGKINHRFIKNKDDDDDAGCLICGNLNEEHIDLLLEKESGIKKKKSKKLKNDEKLLIMENTIKTVPAIKEVKFDQETLDFFENTELCRICFTRNIDEKEEKMKFACGDRFCKECVIKYLKMKIVTGNV